MRMRKKKYLDERLDACRLLIRPRCSDRHYQTAVKEKEYFDLPALFGRDGELWLEIGCGKGQFIVEEAARHPDILYLAVEKSANVIVTACEKAEAAGLTNVRFVNCSAEYLEKYLPENSVGRLYLNFSCPFPKTKYAKHRLTADHFLQMYARLLKPGAAIHQKTDNMHFFEYSLEQYSHSGFWLENVSLDLHNSDFEGNIETEYEQRFAAAGAPIYRLEAYKRP